MTPDVSVIIPAWNAASFVGNAISSALLQNDVTVEVLVVDDASTDGTPAAIAAHDDPRVRGFRQQVNGGPAAARNTALAAARGRWIAVLDADDLMLPDRLRQLVAVAESNGLDIIADNLWVERIAEGAGNRSLMLPEALDGGVTPLGLTEYLRGNLLFGKQLGYGYLKPLFRRSLLEQHGLRYDESLRIAEDFHLVLDALALGARLARHASAGYIYRVGAGSISHRLSLPNAMAMIAADQRFIARFQHSLSSQESQAARAHLRSLTEGAAFVAMVQSIKQRRMTDLLRAATQHPGALRHFSMPIRAALARLQGGVA